MTRIEHGLLDEMLLETMVDCSRLPGAVKAGYMPRQKRVLL